ncbi:MULTISPECIES: hypothetical protein [unclassified Bradyrhizobium]|uniref:hypothetical protein n=1 Tax=unclassified Bradyrhizobium TaxID=2631580 RepID=UPI00263A6712|nr:hypothetical protein [Bradyrhizobium sp. WYCCWR 13022]
MTRDHPCADSRDASVGKLGHCASNHLGKASRNGIRVLWIDDPAVNAGDDLVRLPTGRS